VERGDGRLTLPLSKAVALIGERNCESVCGGAMLGLNLGLNHCSGPAERWMGGLPSEVPIKKGRASQPSAFRTRSHARARLEHLTPAVHRPLHFPSLTRTWKPREAATHTCVSAHVEKEAMRRGDVHGRCKKARRCEGGGRKPSMRRACLSPVGTRGCLAPSRRSARSFQMPAGRTLGGATLRWSRCCRQVSCHAGVVGVSHAEGCRTIALCWPGC